MVVISGINRGIVLRTRSNCWDASHRGSRYCFIKYPDFRLRPLRGRRCAIVGEDNFKIARRVVENGPLFGHKCIAWNPPGRITRHDGANSLLIRAGRLRPKLAGQCVVHFFVGEIFLPSVSGTREIEFVLPNLAACVLEIDSESCCRSAELRCFS